MEHGGDVWKSDRPEDWLDFSASLKPDGPPYWVRSCLRRAMSAVRYYPDPEQKRAREGLARFLGVSPDRVLVCSGGEEALDLAISGETGEVVTAPVAFGEYARLSRIHGRPFRTDNEPLNPGGTRILCNPDNPTGCACLREDVLNTLAECRRSGGSLLVDEAFVHYCPEVSVAAVQEEGLLVAGSMTKILGIPGIRLGYLVSSPERIAACRRRQLPWSLSAGATEIAVALADHREEIMREAQRNARRRQELVRDLTRLGIRVTPSMANFLLLRFPEGMNHVPQTLREKGILVRDCTSFGLPAENVRVAVRTRGDNARLVRTLEELMEGSRRCAENR